MWWDCAWTPVLSGPKTPHSAFSGQWGQLSAHVGEAHFVEGRVTVNLRARGQGVQKLLEATIKGPRVGRESVGIM